MDDDFGTSNVMSLLHKESLDMYNRLHSIAEDINFVHQVHEAYPQLPIFPNLRCGAWYTDPQTATDIPAYFKSTDGHYNNWSFNLRRANLHLLELVVEKQGMVIVDSTRSGKRIPDALSKTIPIWCAVINRVIQRRYAKEGWDVSLYTPPGVVSPQEHRQIEQRLDGWADALQQSSFSLPNMNFPLRPLWITPATSVFPFRDSVLHLEFHPIICVSASQQVSEGLERRNGFTYVQGSGDDHELWGMGLMPDIFWRHKDELLGASRADLLNIIPRLISESSSLAKKSYPSPIEKVGGLILISTLADVSSHSTAIPKYDLLLLDPNLPVDNMPDPIDFGNYSSMSIFVQEGKKGAAHFCQTVLPQAMNFIQARLSAGRTVCIACPDGKDLSVGVGVAALQKFFDDHGKLLQIPRPSTSCGFYHLSDEGSPNAKVVTKNTIRTRLEWIISGRPEANPSRTTLKRINDYFFAPKQLRST
ncbi:hypothetical protein AX16_006204 [Volvariella volvacea WC 439]|nr:hypothetical protein AX16_006204 [Volvariella volvacea WC 439]